MAYDFGVAEMNGVWVCRKEMFIRYLAMSQKQFLPPRTSKLNQEWKNRYEYRGPFMRIVNVMEYEYEHLFLKWLSTRYPATRPMWEED